LAGLVLGWSSAWLVWCLAGLVLGWSGAWLVWCLAGQAGLFIVQTSGEEWRLDLNPRSQDQWSSALPLCYRCLQIQIDFKSFLKIQK
jgi:hypothetical protein